MTYSVSIKSLEIHIIVEIPQVISVRFLNRWNQVLPVGGGINLDGFSFSTHIKISFDLHELIGNIILFFFNFAFVMIWFRFFIINC